MSGLSICGQCPCSDSCNSASSTRSAVVRKVGATSWTLLPDDSPVHLAALFRDPGIRDDRDVPLVLDLRPESNPLRAGERCWVRRFVALMEALPNGIQIALDNGVRCRCPQSQGYQEYEKRVLNCHERTAQWFAKLKHLNGGKPGVVICDQDLCNALAAWGLMKRQNGQKWIPPRTFVKRVGAGIEYLGVNGLVLAHPSNLNYAHRVRYRKALMGAIPAVISLARLRESEQLYSGDHSGAET